MAKTPIEIIMDRVEWHEIEHAEPLEDKSIPYATHEGILDFGEEFPKLRCYILNNGQRILDADDVGNFFLGNL